MARSGGGGRRLGAALVLLCACTPEQPVTGADPAGAASRDARELAMRQDRIVPPPPLPGRLRADMTPLPAALAPAAPPPRPADPPAPPPATAPEAPAEPRAPSLALPGAPVVSVALAAQPALDGPAAIPAAPLPAEPAMERPPAQAAPPSPIVALAAAPPAASPPAPARAAPPAAGRAAPPPATPPAPARGAVRVQLAAAGSEAEALRYWASLGRRLPDHTEGRAPTVEPLQQAGRPTLWRLRIAGFASRAEAEGWCGALRERQLACWVLA